MLGATAWGAPLFDDLKLQPHPRTSPGSALTSLHVGNCYLPPRIPGQSHRDRAAGAGSAREAVRSFRDLEAAFVGARTPPPCSAEAAGGAPPVAAAAASAAAGGALAQQAQAGGAAAGGGGEAVGGEGGAAGGAAAGAAS